MKEKLSEYVDKWVNVGLSTDKCDVDAAIKEVSPFIKDKSGFEFWSRDYFKLLTDKVIFEKRQ